MLFTDGITEAEDACGTGFGEERLVQVLQNAAGHTAEEASRALMEAVIGYWSGNFRDRRHCRRVGGRVIWHV